MVPDFYVFDTFQACKLILNIEANGFNAFVCEKGLGYLHDRLVNDKRFKIYYNSDRIPIMCICTDEDVEDWALVYRWVDQVIIFGGESTITLEDLNFQKPFHLRREYTPAGKEAVVEGINSHVFEIPPDNVDLKNGYNYTSFYDDMQDIKYYEITSPSSETPFTVVVNNFSKKNDSWLFSDIYVSNAWAANNMECRYDFHFLTVLWKHLKLPGEFTMDVVKRRVDACYPDRVKDLNDLENEPSVYRRTMLEVIGMKRKRESGQVYIDTKDPRLE